MIVRAVASPPAFVAIECACWQRMILLRACRRTQRACSDWRRSRSTMGQARAAPTVPRRICHPTTREQGVWVGRPRALTIVFVFPREIQTKLALCMHARACVGDWRRHSVRRGCRSRHLAPYHHACQPLHPLLLLRALCTRGCGGGCRRTSCRRCRTFSSILLEVLISAYKGSLGRRYSLKRCCVRRRRAGEPLMGIPVNVVGWSPIAVYDTHACGRFRSTRLSAGRLSPLG